MVIRPQSGSTATEEMASAPMALGEWIDDPKLLVCSHEGYRWQWQALPGQQPQWVPVSKVRPVPQVDAMAWDAGPQRPTVVLPLAAQPKASVAPRRGHRNQSPQGPGWRKWHSLSQSQSQSKIQPHRQAHLHSSSSRQCNTGQGRQKATTLLQH